MSSDTKGAEGSWKPYWHEHGSAVSWFGCPIWLVEGPGEAPKLCYRLLGKAEVRALGAPDSALREDAWTPAKGSMWAPTVIEEPTPVPPPVVKKEPKRLVVEVTQMSGSPTATVKIIEQTHREHSFGGRPGSTDQKHEFISSGGFRLASVSAPQSISYTLYVRGDAPSRDNERVEVALEEVAALMDAVEEYNAAFA